MLVDLICNSAVYIAEKVLAVVFWSFAIRLRAIGIVLVLLETVFLSLCMHNNNEIISRRDTQRVL